MNYNEHEIMNAFKIYAELSLKGECDLNAYESFMLDDRVRGLVEQFCDDVNCTVLVTDKRLLLIPLIMGSPFHISNERLKKDYLPKNALNADIYLLYFAIIILYGLFYDSYNTTEPVLEFLPMAMWLDTLNQYIETLANHDQDSLHELEKEMQYNWLAIIDKWHAIDDTNEKVKKQNARTNSRLSFMNSVKEFMVGQELLVDVGNMEVVLTEKSKDVVRRYYMDSEHNRNLLEFLYSMEDKEAVNGDNI